MKVKFGKGTSQYGPGVQIDLTGDEVAHAIYTYLVAHDINIFGPRTITVNGELCKVGQVYVDPSGRVIANGIGYDGKGHDVVVKNKLLSWAKSCHFDSTIVTKERKGKRWMAALSHIERLGHFNIDNYSKIENSWQIIKDTIERMSDEELRKLDLARRND
jgi:hypothetical protein